LAIFLDTGVVSEIKQYLSMGIVRGVTTNPTILLRDGVSGGTDGIKERMMDVARLIHPLPLSVEVTNNDRRGMVDEALMYAGWADNINVKITIHGPNGELDNMEVIHELESKHDVRVNVTAMMSAQQCFLAAMAGATYVSLFGGRVNNMGYNCIQEIEKIRSLLDQFDLKSKIIIGSVREVINVAEWLEAGAHIVTATPSILKGMIVHPYSKETVQQFLQDAAKIHGSKS
jgi:transaldolase